MTHFAPVARRAVPAVALVAMLTACGPGAATTEAPKQSTAPTVPADGGTYGSVAALRDAYVKAGGTCPDFQQRDQMKLAAESAECDSSTVLSTFLSSEEVNQQIKLTRGFISAVREKAPNAPAGEPWLVGKNWILNVKEPEKFQDKLGGQIVSFGGK